MIDFAEYEKIVYKDGSGGSIKKKTTVHYSNGRQEKDNIALVISDSLYIHLTACNGIYYKFNAFYFKTNNTTEQIYHLGYIGI